MMTEFVKPVKNVREKINNTAALKESGLTIVHMNAPFMRDGKKLYRAMTVAYEQINKSHLKISTSVTHKADTFTKKVGTKIALENFKKGNTVVIPLASGNIEIAEQLRNMFGYIQA